MLTSNNDTVSQLPTINRVVDYKLTEGAVTEPVTLALAKSYARCVTGNTEDDLFTLLITAARKAIEKYTGLSLVAKTANVTLINMTGYFELPYGPVLASPAPVYKDVYGSIITPTIVGYDFPQIQDPLATVTTADYSVGYTTVPEELKVAVLAQITFMYENRGDNSDSATVCPLAQKICQKYSRIPWFN